MGAFPRRVTVCASLEEGDRCDELGGYKGLLQSLFEMGRARVHGGAVRETSKPPSFQVNAA